MTTRFALRFPLPRTWSRPAPAAPGSRGRARAAVLIGAAAVVAAHLALAAAVETNRPEWRDPEFFHRQTQLSKIVRWEKDQGRARPLVVVVGGSRPQMGFSPEHLGLGGGPADPLVFNCAQSGCSPVGEKLNLSRLFASGVAPDFVLLEVLPPVLADPGPMDDRVPLPRLSHADLARLRPYHADPDRVWRGWARARANSWHTLRLPLMANWGAADAFPPGPHRPDILWAGMKFFGSAPFYPADWPADARAAQLALARRQYGFLLDAFRVEPVNDRAIRDALADCRGRGVRAAVFTMPESPAFRAWYPPGVRGAVAAYLGSLSREFGVPVFDASAWIDDEAAFMDGHHLLGPGAEAFSTRFGRECVGPWVRGTPPADPPR